MLHYFLLPDLTRFGDSLIAEGNQVVTQFCVIGVVTLAVTGGSLLLSNVLRTSPVLAKWLFGVGKGKMV